MSIRSSMGVRSGYYTDAANPYGMVLCGQRWYLTSVGIWLSRDPIGYAGGENLYAYCDNNPVSGLDPSGLQGIGDYAKAFFSLETWKNGLHTGGAVVVDRLTFRATHFSRGMENYPGYDVSDGAAWVAQQAEIELLSAGAGNLLQARRAKQLANLEQKAAEYTKELHGLMNADDQRVITTAVGVGERNALFGKRYQLFLATSEKSVDRVIRAVAEAKGIKVLKRVSRFLKGYQGS